MNMIVFIIFQLFWNQIIFHFLSKKKNKKDLGSIGCPGERVHQAKFFSLFIKANTVTQEHSAADLARSFFGFNAAFLYNNYGAIIHAYSAHVL